MRRRFHIVACACSLLWLATAAAAEPMPPRAGSAPPRTGTTTPFGSGSITNRSDGSSSQTRPFGSGSITTDRTRDGRTVTGQTQKFGSGTITRWSDGTTTETRPFGAGSITTERTRDGRTVTGQTQKFGSGTITNRSDGSSSQTTPFGNGTLQRDTPGRKESVGQPSRLPSRVACSASGTLAPHQEARLLPHAAGLRPAPTRRTSR